MKRSLRDFALVAEIVGAVSVVISLIYVGLSVNQNTNAIMVANHQALVAMDQDTNAWIRSPEFAAIYETATEDVSRLTPVQSLQYFTFVADKFNAWEFAFITHNDEMMEENIWDGYDSYYRSLLGQKSVRFWWNTGRVTFSPAFTAYVDSILAETE